MSGRGMELLESMQGSLEEVVHEIFAPLSQERRQAGPVGLENSVAFADPGAKAVRFLEKAKLLEAYLQGIASMDTAPSTDLESAADQRILVLESELKRLDTIVQSQTDNLERWVRELKDSVNSATGDNDGTGSEQQTRGAEN